ncbi:MAG: hypothetical protein R3181_04900 [Rubricoccaceae bacterium]|nr:hypothetical protein [Rubricoccaceae bacterium]
MRLSPVLVLAALAACTPAEPSADAPSPPELSPRPTLVTAADTLAWRITEAAGGLDAWHALPRLRFDFAVVRESTEVFRARHLWDRASGRYRVEYPIGEDSTLVALFDLQRFNPAAPEGTVFVNGVPVDSAAARDRLAEAHTRHVNDAYWLLAPLKLFDPGVRRSLVPDSARAGSEVLMLSFDGVGLTPGDRYWLTADAEGRLSRWSFALEGGGTGAHVWDEYVALPTPQGDLRLSTRKRTAGRAILTPVHPAEGFPPDVFEQPQPVL